MELLFAVACLGPALAVLFAILTWWDECRSRCPHGYYWGRCCRKEDR